MRAASARLLDDMRRSLGGAECVPSPPPKYCPGARDALYNATQSERRATQWFHTTSLRFNLAFSTGHTGLLHPGRLWLWFLAGVPGESQRLKCC